MTYVRPNIYKQTNIPGFQLCYPCKCLTRHLKEQQQQQTKQMRNVRQGVTVFKMNYCHKEF